MEIQENTPKKVALALTDFALPVPRRGSIDVLSGYGRATELGQEVHLRVQSRHADAFPSYRSEVPVSHSFTRGGFEFELSGRMDGFYDDPIPRIEEIKSTFNIWELNKRLRDGSMDHPYCLQLLTYGYLFYLKEKQIPTLTFHLVSTRNFESEELEIKLSIPRYEAWLDLRLEELVQEAQAAEKRAQRRRKTSEVLSFPFETPRPGQIELIETIELGIQDKKRMLIQAPTGLGKTVGVLYPTLKEALSRGQKVVYVTPKNSQHAVAEDAVTLLQGTIEKSAAKKLKSLTITAKSKICFKNEPLCNPEYCEYAKDHYTKMAEHKVLEELARKKKLTSRTFRKLGETYQVCPFELQLDAAQDAEVVICDYNYVFAPRSAFGRLAKGGLDQEGKPNLVIDEVHNLPSRSMDYYSPTLSTYTLEKMLPEAEELPKHFRGEFCELIRGCMDVIKGLKTENGTASRIEPPAEPFLEQDSLLRTFLNRYLESDVEIQAGDVVLRLVFYWSQFTDALEFIRAEENDQFFTTFQPLPSGGAVKITCCDASRMLKACYDEYENVVGFSATLKPFDYYRQLSGLSEKNLRTSEFPSPFPKSNRKLLIIPQISSKFSERSKNYPKIAETIRKISELRAGNYLAFFPSFDFMEKVLDQFVAPLGFMVIQQERGMRSDAIQAVLEHLRQAQTPTLLFAVQGGVFSEGVDYPGNMVIGSFIVGPPLPNFDLEREQMRDYYQTHYSAGFDYAYTFPAMAKAVQAAGRVIRSEKDKGLIVLMDNRFLHPSYTQSMPEDWFKSNVQELVSSSILKEVTEFWENT